MIPTIRRNEVNNTGHSIGNVGPETMRIPDDPVKDDGTVCPGKNVLRRKTEYLLTVAE